MGDWNLNGAKSFVRDVRGHYGTQGISNSLIRRCFSREIPMETD
jgi:hypothetical protein